jgi:PAS domain S-box-containing protein
VHNQDKTKEELIVELQELRLEYDSCKYIYQTEIERSRKGKDDILLLSNAIRSISECVSITDMNDQIIFVNSAFLKTYQYEEKDIIGKSIDIVRSSNNPKTISELILPATLQGGWQGELLNRKKDGSEFPVFVSTSVIKDYDGKPIALIGVTSDRSQQKKLELERQVFFDMTLGLSETANLNELLLAIHLSLKKVLYAENCFVAIYDEKTKLFNFPYFIDQLDPKPEPLAMRNSLTSYVFRTGKPLLLTPELFRKLVEKKEAALVGSPSPSWIGVPLKTPSKTIGVLVLQHYDKENVYSKDDIQFLYSAASKIAVAVERKQAEEALRQSEKIMRSITDSVYDAIVMADAEGLISFWNPAAERIFGYTRSEAMGVNLHNLIVPLRFHQAHYDALPKFQQTGQGSAMGKILDMDAHRKDGNEIAVQMSLSAIQLNNEWHAVGVLRDVTDQKKIEQSLVKAKQQAEQANNSKSIFLANMSHEIRTPLNAIIGFSQLMNRDKQLSDEQKEYNSSIIHAGEHLLELINNILELSKIEAGRAILSPANVDLHALCEDVRGIFRERIRSKNLQYICEIDTELPRLVFVDESKLRQIFVNLIGNALKFTEEGGIAVRVRIDKNEKDILRLVVEIQDSGPGIGEDEIDKLFKHFEQTRSGISKGTGTGLGLALSRELAILMGGDITVSSKLGEGSVFKFWVDIQEGNSEAIEKNAIKKVIGYVKEETPFRILVVDDQKDNLKVASTLLKLVGFETEEAINGEEAIERFEAWNPHLILMDMRMPVMDGYEATNRIKSTEEGKQTPIVALTASTFEDELKKIDALGIQGYIRKPFRESELFQTIGKILGIQFIFENEPTALSSNYMTQDGAISRDVAEIPNSLLLKMQNALSVADLDLLMELIKGLGPDLSELSKHLMNLASVYDYIQLQRILQKR